MNLKKQEELKLSLGKLLTKYGISFNSEEDKEKFLKEAVTTTVRVSRKAQSFQDFVNDTQEKLNSML